MISTSDISFTEFNPNHLRVAVIHHWWLSNRGGEAVASALIDVFPHADLYLNVCDEKLVRATLGQKFKGKVFTTFINGLPWAKNHYQKYLPLMPLALEQLDLSEYDLVISIESGPAKGVITNPDTLHICYCNSPMRYLWDMYPQYVNNSGLFIRSLFPLVAHWLRVWDYASSGRVDFFVSNSNFIAKRVYKYYKRSSDVIFPPVNVDKFDPSKDRNNFYLYLGQLTSYKRPDLAIATFNENGLPLVVIGEGEELIPLQKIAKSNIQFLGRQSFEVVKKHLELCKGLIFPGIEDFGIVPVEAMAAGAPVIAYGKGGVLDTVINGKTGILFKEQSIDSLQEAICTIESNIVKFDPMVLHAHAKTFDKAVFQRKILALVKVKLSLDFGSQ